MALKANRPTGTAGSKKAVGAPAPAQQTAPTEVEVEQPTQQEAPAQVNTPAVQQSAPPAQRPAGARNQMADVNAGVLDNIEDLTGGNYVSIDGSDFLYKSREEHVREIDMIIASGKRFYQFFDEEAQKAHNSDTKLDDRFKLKFEIRWFEEDEEGEFEEYIMTLPTASAMNFINYVKGLARQGKAVNQIVTRLSLSRQTNIHDKSIRYSRVEFANVGDAE